jgi:hypothetical protein
LIGFWPQPLRITEIATLARTSAFRIFMRGTPSQGKDNTILV